MSSSMSCVCSGAGCGSCGSGRGSAPAPEAPGGGRSSSLERLETSEQSLGITVQSSAAHHRHRRERAAIIEALRGCPDNGFAKRCSKLADCCATPQVGLTDAGAVGCVWFRCRDRLCPLCAAQRATEVAQRVLDATSAADSLRFLTLTVLSTDAPLREQLDALYAWYREMRRTAAWRAHVVGGVATVEVTRNAETGQWHPHLHVLTDGRFWAQADIADLWERVTGSSRIVDIRKVNRRSTVSKYVAKYASKPAKMDAWPPDAIREYAEAIHRRRMVITTGSMHGVHVDRDSEAERSLVAGDRIPLSALERRSNVGCERASIVLGVLAAQSAGYQQSLSSRRGGQAPTLASPSVALTANVRDAWDDLATLWQDDPVSFVNGGSGDWIKQAVPPRPAGSGRIRDHSGTLGDWHRREHRML